MTEPARSEARLLGWAAGWAAAGTASAVLLMGLRAALGFSLGSALALLNYLWLHQAIERLMDSSSNRVPKKLVFKFVARYPLMFAGVYLFFKTGWLPFTAVLAGLFVPVAAVLVEGVFQIREGLRQT